MHDVPRPASKPRLLEQVRGEPAVALHCLVEERLGACGEVEEIGAVEFFGALELGVHLVGGPSLRSGMTSPQAEARAWRAPFRDGLREARGLFEAGLASGSSNSATAIAVVIGR